MPYIYDSNTHRNQYVNSLPVSGGAGTTASSNFTAAEKTKLAGIAANADATGATLEEIIAYSIIASMGRF